MKRPDLRPYQRHIVAEFERITASSAQRPIIVAPTGAGKTVIGSEIIRSAVADHKWCWSLRRTAAKSLPKPAENFLPTRYRME